MFAVQVLLVLIFVFACVRLNFTKEFKLKPNLVGSLAALILLLVIFPLTSAFGIVPAGDTGVVTQFGAVVKGENKPEGLYFVTPGIQQVHLVDTRPHRIEIDSGEAVTSDRQEVHTSVNLIVQIDPATADRTYDQYRDSIVDQVVYPKFQESVKTVTARYDAKTQVQNRGMVQAEMLAYVQHELAGKGVIIGPGALSIINFTYNSDYQAAIEASAVSQQNLVKARADLAVAKIDAQSKVAAANGEAQSQALLARTISDKSLGYKFLERWDGHLPTVLGAGQNIMDISSLMGKKE